MATPLDVVHLGRVQSTQDEAAARYGGTPLLVTATGQDAGRGRSGAAWLDSDRALAASLAFEPGWDFEDLPVITLVAGLAVLDVLPKRVGVKWPNDIVIGDAKAGGILTESSGGLVRIGLGLNVYWAEPPEGMIALHDRDPGVDHVRRIAERWAAALKARVGRGAIDWGAEEYAERCVTIGREITWEPSGAGVAVGIAADGGLMVETPVGEEVLHSGAVHEVRPD